MCPRTYWELERVWREEREHQRWLLSALRADIHNTAGKAFTRHFEPSDFMGDKTQSIEKKVHELIAQGYSPAAACALATAKKSIEQNRKDATSTLQAIDAANQKRKGRSRGVVKKG